MVPEFSGRFINSNSDIFDIIIDFGAIFQLYDRTKMDDVELRKADILDSSTEKRQSIAANARFLVHVSPVMAQLFHDIFESKSSSISGDFAHDHLPADIAIPAFQFRTKMEVVRFDRRSDFDRDRFRFTPISDRFAIDFGFCVIDSTFVDESDFDTETYDDGFEKFHIGRISFTLFRRVPNAGFVDRMDRNGRYSNRIRLDFASFGLEFDYVRRL